MDCFINVVAIERVAVVVFCVSSKGLEGFAFDRHMFHITMLACTQMGIWKLHFDSEKDPMKIAAAKKEFGFVDCPDLDCDFLHCFWSKQKRLMRDLKEKPVTGLEQRTIDYLRKSCKIAEVNYQDPKFAIQLAKKHAEVAETKKFSGKVVTKAELRSKAFLEAQKLRGEYARAAKKGISMEELSDDDAPITVDSSSDGSDVHMNDDSKSDNTEMKEGS